jgi:hypothetical protein
MLGPQQNQAIGVGSIATPAVRRWNFCPECGRKREADWRFCPMDGTLLEPPLFLLGGIQGYGSQTQGVA